MGEPKFNDVEGDVLVERVEDESAHAVVIGGAVDEKEATEEAELSDGIIRSAGRLQALHSRDADSDMGFLDHGHVVGTVADGQRHGLRLNCHGLHYLGLLAGRYATANDRPTLQAQL